MKKRRQSFIKFLSFFTATSSLVAIVSSCANNSPTNNSQNNIPSTNNTNDVVTSKFKITPEHTNSQTGISDVISYQATTDNVSVFFVKRNGAFIAIQELLAAIYLKQLNPDKEIYFYIGSGDIQDDSTNGINNIDYLSLQEAYHNFHFAKSITSDTSLHDEDLADVIKSLKPNQKIDLFIEDFAITELDYSLSKNLINSWPKINSVTFPTDGSFNLGFNENEYNWLKTKTSEEINSYLKTWNDLFEGKVNVNDPDIKWDELSKILPMLVTDSTNSTVHQKVNVWNATNQGFKDWSKGKNNNPVITLEGGGCAT